MQYKNEGENLTQNHKHEICFRLKQKGNTYISCACAHACLSLLEGQSRGRNVQEMSAVQQVPQTQISTLQYIYIYIYIWSDLFSAQFASL